MLRFLSKHRDTILNRDEILNYLFYFIRYFPLLVLTNAWFLFDGHGLFYILSKLYFEEFSKIINIKSYTLNSLIFFLSILMTSVNTYFLYEFVNIKRHRTQNQNKIKLPKSIKFLTISLFYLCFYFSNFSFEMIFYSIFRKYCKDDSPVYSTYNDNFFMHVIKNCTSFSSFSLILNIFFLANLLMMQYFFDLYLFSPYHVRKHEYIGEINGIRFTNLLFPFLNFFIFFEKLFFMNN